MKRLLFIALLCAGCMNLTEDSGRMRHVERTEGDVKVVEIDLRQPEGAKDPTRWTRSPDGTVTLEFGSQYNLEKIRQAFKAFRIWHVMGIILALLGGYMAYSTKCLNRWSLGLIGAGLGMGVFAHVVPAMSLWALIGMGSALLAGLGYLAWNKGLHTPTPED